MKKQNLIPVIKAAEEFGVNRQTIANWQDEGILPVTFIKRNRFVPRNAMEKLKGLYPTAIEEANKMEEYRQKVLSAQEELKAEIESLRKERIYRHYAPSHMKSFAEKFTLLMKTMVDESYKVLADERLIHCWLFGYDINETCKEMGLSYNRYVSSAKGYNNILERMDDYIKMVEENKKLKAELQEARGQLHNLQMDMDDYRARFDKVDEEQSMKENYPILNKPITELDFSVRTLKVLKMYDFETLGQIIRYSRFDLLKMRHFGKKSLFEIIDLLDEFGLELNSESIGTPQL